MNLVVIFEGTIFRAQMVHDLLENEGIKSFINDEIIGTRSAVYMSGFGGVRVMVAETDLDKAKIVVEQYEKTIL